MRIQSSTPASRPNAGKSQGNAGKSELFSKILDEKRKDSSAEIDPAIQALPLTTNGEQRPTFQNLTREPEAVAGSHGLSNITELANEIVGHIVSGGTQNAPMVDIEFKSQTLAGLQVKIQSFGGAVSVNFSAGVPRVAELLSNNLDSLRLALENRGIRIKHLGISSRTAGATTGNGRWTR